MKIHKLKTLTDFYKVVTVDNIDNLHDDFRLYLESLVRLKNELKLKGLDWRQATGHRMEWKNDGINKLNDVKINLTTPKTK